MMAELHGRQTGFCEGKGGLMHIADFGIGILGAAALSRAERRCNDRRGWTAVPSFTEPVKLLSSTHD
jgi:hypothetical protein